MMQKVTLLFVLCFTMLKAPAQENTLNCNVNLKQALTYLRGNGTIQKDSLKAIATLKPCLRAKNANAQLIMGHLYLNTSNKKRIRKGFQLIRKAAKQKHPVAMENLAVLYKYGRGTKLNYNKARKWFQKAAELGNDKAAYSLGYMSFKGLGNTPQEDTPRNICCIKGTPLQSD
jgi:TPR repeat protein